jgi:four helix bundle protein
MGEIKSYKDLIVYQKGLDLVNDIYKITRGYPKEEIFGLTNQMRRAAISVPTNISEGYGRDSTKNYTQFLKISKGSLFELETLLIISTNQKLISDQIMKDISFKIHEIGKMLTTLIKNIEKTE